MVERARERERGGERERERKKEIVLYELEGSLAYIVSSRSYTMRPCLKEIKNYCFVRIP